MAGTKLLTKLDAKTCLKLAWRAAQDLGYSLTPIEDCSKCFTATKGSALLSVFTGPFSPHCVFEVSVNEYSDANEVVLVKNQPWVITGSAGVAKVNRQADDLMQAIGCAIEKAGGAILERKEF